MPKCYSVKLKSLVSISDKCYLATDFNGNEDLIPKSQFFGNDHESIKSDAYWISEWILSKKKITYGNKWTLFTKQGKNVGRVTIKKHVPEKLNINEFTTASDELLK